MNFVLRNIHVDPRSSLAAGFTVDWDTIAWWLREDENARNGMANAGLGYPVDKALVELNTWFVNTFRDQNFKRVWGNGSSFDLAMLQYAARKMGTVTPWSYRTERDMRTLVELCPDGMYVKPKIKHDALEDAIAQSKTVINCADWLVGRGVNFS